MTRWRYTLKLVSLEGEEVVRVQSSLNSLGETGWEAVAGFLILKPRAAAGC